MFIIDFMQYDRKEKSQGAQRMAATPEIRKVNKRDTYRYIYHNKKCSKQELVHSLKQSLPTINQNLNTLLEEGMIQTGGLYESTGGRKATILQCTSDARVAVGVEIMNEHVAAVLLDLYGKVLCCNELREKYADEEKYFQKVGQFIADFIESTGYTEEKNLGIVIATQGIVDYDHQKVIYGRILNNVSLSAEKLETYIGKKCILMHDSETAAFAESFHRPDLRDSSYIFLNKYLGSASIINGTLYRGNHGRGQLIEHMKLDKNGRKCYCGQRGCAECYCSVHSLEDISGLEMDVFFPKLRNRDERILEIWDTYMESLAFVLHNVLMVMDVDIIIGGLLRKYMIQEDLNLLKMKIEKQSDFDISDRTISFEFITNYSAAQGAALYLVKGFLDEYEA